MIFLQGGLYLNMKQITIFIEVRQHLRDDN